MACAGVDQEFGIMREGRTIDSGDVKCIGKEVFAASPTFSVDMVIDAPFSLRALVASMICAFEGSPLYFFLQSTSLCPGILHQEHLGLSDSPLPFCLPPFPLPPFSFFSFSLAPFPLATGLLKVLLKITATIVLRSCFIWQVSARDLYVVTRFLITDTSPTTTTLKCRNAGRNATSLYWIDRMASSSFRYDYIVV